MWREPHSVIYNGRKVSLKALAQAFGVSYDSCLHRWNRGYRDPWELMFGEGAGPIKFRVTPEQMKWLRETRACRKGQVQTKKGYSRIDSEWVIACDLIGIPRVFANELKEAMGA